MKTKQYKVIIQYYASDTQDVLLYENKAKAFEAYDCAEFDSCVAYAALFNSDGKGVNDVPWSDF
tara:strand:+ start:986 stop:1177 length:192 start_codon:yes stop_codon:yes gene_type:complete